MLLLEGKSQIVLTNTSVYDPYLSTHTWENIIVRLSLLFTNILCRDFTI